MNLRASLLGLTLSGLFAFCLFTSGVGCESSDKRHSDVPPSPEPAHAPAMAPPSAPPSGSHGLPPHILPAPAASIDAEPGSSDGVQVTPVSLEGDN